MGSAFMLGIEVVKLAARHGWDDRGPGGSHPHVLARPGSRPVPVRDKIQNPNEVRALLKQLDIPRAEWPAKVR